MNIFLSWLQHTRLAKTQCGSYPESFEGPIAGSRHPPTRDLSSGGGLKRTPLPPPRLSPPPPFAPAVAWLRPTRHAARSLSPCTHNHRQPAMASEVPAHEHPNSRPSTSGQHSVVPVNGVKRSFTHLEENRYDDPRYIYHALPAYAPSPNDLDSLMSLPSNDTDAYYYPSNGFDVDEDLPSAPFRGNWGLKTFNEAKWVRKGKMTSWGPWMEEWEVRSLAYSCDGPLIVRTVGRPR